MMKSAIGRRVSSTKLTLEGSPKQNDILPKTRKNWFNCLRDVNISEYLYSSLILYGSLLDLMRDLNDFAL